MFVGINHMMSRPKYFDPLIFENLDILTFSEIKFVVNLDKGKQYILLSVATWLAQKGNIGTTNAFVYYSYRINVI
jgi:hypothetical protein